AAEFALCIAQARAPAPDQILYRWNGRYGLTLGVIDGDWLMASALDGTFRIDLSRRLITCFVTHAQDPAWLDVFLRRVAPRIVILAGGCALHAAAVKTGEGALLLLGGSGAGKSTLSASLAVSGWDVLSDDIALLWDRSSPCVAPATTGVCVWDDSRTALRLDAERCTLMPGYEGKSRFTSGHDIATAPVPLRGLVFLSRSAEISSPIVEQLSGADGMARAGPQRIRFNPADASGDETRATFEWLAAVTRRVACFQMTYPCGYAALGAVEQTLRELAMR
ncbi:MAG: hypothetical protein ABIS14_01630, partial [Sphingomonas sp.]